MLGLQLLRPRGEALAVGLHGLALALDGLAARGGGRGLGGRLLGGGLGGRLLGGNRLRGVGLGGLVLGLDRLHHGGDVLGRHRVERLGGGGRRRGHEVVAAQAAEPHGLEAGGRAARAHLHALDAVAGAAALVVARLLGGGGGLGGGGEHLVARGGHVARPGLLLRLPRGRGLDPVGLLLLALAFGRLLLALLLPLGVGLPLLLAGVLVGQAGRVEHLRQRGVHDLVDFRPLARLLGRVLEGLLELHDAHREGRAGGELDAPALEPMLHDHDDVGPRELAVTHDPHHEAELFADVLLRARGRVGDDVPARGGGDRVGLARGLARLGVSARRLVPAGRGAEAGEERGRLPVQLPVEDAVLLPSVLLQSGEEPLGRVALHLLLGLGDLGLVALPEAGLEELGQLTRVHAVEVVEDRDERDGLGGRHCGKSPVRCVAQHARCEPGRDVESGSMPSAYIRRLPLRGFRWSTCAAWWISYNFSQNKTQKKRKTL